MPRLMFKLRRLTVAMRHDSDYRKVVTIPGDVCVTLLACDIAGNGAVQIQYLEERLEIAAVDLRTIGRLVESSAALHSA